jgi:hypothetical protein
MLEGEQQTPNQEAEYSFDDYLGVLARYEDPSVSFHQIGIRDAEQLRSLSSQPGTMFLNGLPSLVPLEAADSLIDIDRSSQIASKFAEDDKTDDAKIFASIVPAQYVQENISDISEQLGDKKGYIFAEWDIDCPGSQELKDLKAEGRLHFLVHPVSETLAGLNFYRITAKTNPESVREQPLSLAQVVDAQEIGFSEIQDDGGSLTVTRGSRLNDEDKTQLWDLFRTRFNDISDNLPIRLEEDEESTMSVLEDPNFAVSYRKEPDGKISCAVLFTDVKEAYPWISEEFLETQKSIRAESGNTEEVKEIFVPGVAAYKTEGLKASFAVLQKVAETSVETGAPSVAFQFESTDVSSLYVPKISSDGIKANPRLTLGEVSRLAQKKYVLIEVN